MLRSLKHRLLFVHIAEPGGTRVREALQGLRWRDTSSPNTASALCCFSCSADRSMTHTDALP